VSKLHVSTTQRTQNVAFKTPLRNFISAILNLGYVTVNQGSSNKRISLVLCSRDSFVTNPPHLASFLMSSFIL